MSNRHLDRVMSSDYLDGLTSWTLEEVRSRRAECQTLEDAASFLRRLVQGRLDIIGTELRSRAGDQPADLETLVEQLPSILADRSDRRSLGGRFMSSFFPEEMQQTWAQARCDTACGGRDVAMVPDLSEADLFAMTDGLSALERQVSIERRRLHEVYDALQSELIKRYKSGEAKVEGLLA